MASRKSRADIETLIGTTVRQVLPHAEFTGSTDLFEYTYYNFSSVTDIDIRALQNALDDAFGANKIDINVSLQHTGGGDQSHGGGGRGMSIRMTVPKHGIRPMRCFFRLGCWQFVLWVLIQLFLTLLFIRIVALPQWMQSAAPQCLVQLRRLYHFGSFLTLEWLDTANV